MTLSPQFFLDSSFLVAYFDDRDLWHEKATAIFKEINQETHELFLSDVVINETLSVMAKRCEAKKHPEYFKHLAKQFQTNLSEHPILCLYEFLPKNYSQIISLMIQHNGRLNFHDCLILFFLKETPQVTLVTFDNDFKEMKNSGACPRVLHK